MLEWKVDSNAFHWNHLDTIAKIIGRLKYQKSIISNARIWGLNSTEPSSKQYSSFINAGYSENRRLSLNNIDVKTWHRKVHTDLYRGWTVQSWLACPSTWTPLGTVCRHTSTLCHFLVVASCPIIINLLIISSSNAIIHYFNPDGSKWIQIPTSKSILFFLHS